MEKGGQFNQEQKLVILESAQEVGIKEASRMAGVHQNDASFSKICATMTAGPFATPSLKSTLIS